MKLSETEIHDLHTDDSIFCDIGARVGEFSIPRADRCKIVYAFEPSPHNFGELVENAKQFGDKYKCYDIAFSDKSYDCITEFKDCRDTVEQEIKYRRMDEFFQEQQLDLPTYVKIDVEGMESAILKTMDFIFEKKIPIYCEIHHNTDTWDSQDFEDNPSFKTPSQGGFDFNHLKNYGYKVYSHIHSEHGNNTKLMKEDEDYNPPNYNHWGMFMC
tara:strand:+ start:132 stop:773 length:642 start_codon:yes stop_codon:yes gene_type:complete